MKIKPTKIHKSHGTGEFKPKDRSILVTGAGGFLGGVILTYLRRHGVRVVGTARAQVTQADEQFIYLDIEDSTALKSLDTMGPYDTVIHCAAVLPGKRSDLDLLIANQRMTYNLVEWATSRNVSDFFFASSCSIYGYSDQPCTELSLPAPANIYAASKLACEQIIQIVAGDTGMRVCILRISAPYGPSLRTKTVIKRFLKQGAQNQPLTLIGSGSRSQDFVYEDDVARAFFLAITHGATGVFNISGDHSVSMRELAETVLRIFGRDDEQAITFSGVDPQESYRGRFPIEAAVRAFDYQPQVTFEEGLRRSAHGWGLL